MMTWGDGWWVVGALFMVACMFLMGRMMMSHGGSHHGGHGHSEHGGHDDFEEGGSRPNAPEILAERFARGEISKEEFEQRTRVLERQSK